MSESLGDLLMNEINSLFFSDTSSSPKSIRSFSGPLAKARISVSKSSSKVTSAEFSPPSPPDRESYGKNRELHFRSSRA